MSTASGLRDMVAYDLWANRRALESLGSVRSDGDGAEAALRLMAHIAGAQEVWMARIRGRDARALETWPGMTADECAQRIERMAAEWATLLEGAGDAELDRVVDYVTQAGAPYTSRLGDILVHVANHGTYHRAQVARIVKQGGGIPAATDFILYTRETRAPAPNRP